MEHAHQVRFKGVHTCDPWLFTFLLVYFTTPQNVHQTELMIRRVQFIRRTKEAATQAACAGNTRGYHSEYGNSCFNNRENDDAYYMFRSYNNCYYSSSEPVTDEEDELQLHSNLYLVQE